MGIVREIEGIGRHIDSGKSGKTVGVLSLTHGNEPVGLQAQEERLNQGYADHVVSGDMYLIQVNLEAQQQNKRFVDVNMNRIIGKDENKQTYEYKRFQQLLPYLYEMDIVLDIHSTTQEINSLMGICHTKDVTIAQEVLDTQRILVDDNFNNQGSITSVVTRRGGMGFGIECGSHESADARHNALENIHRILTYGGCYDADTQNVNATVFKPVFRFYEEIFPVSGNFSYTKDYDNFDVIVPGEVYATDGDVMYRNNTDYDLYIGLLGYVVRVGDGMCFLFEKL